MWWTSATCWPSSPRGAGVPDRFRCNPRSCRVRSRICAHVAAFGDTRARMGAHVSPRSTCGSDCLKDAYRPARGRRVLRASTGPRTRPRIRRRRMRGVCADARTMLDGDAGVTVPVDADAGTSRIVPRAVLLKACSGRQLAETTRPIVCLSRTVRSSDALPAPARIRTSTRFRRVRAPESRAARAVHAECAACAGCTDPVAAPEGAAPPQLRPALRRCSSAVMNSCRCPSSTVCGLPTSCPVRWSLTRLS